jgi:hypothetical protein
MGASFQNSRFMILIRCEACGGTHSVTFSDLKEFVAVRCRDENKPIFSDHSRFAKVYREFQEDILSGSIAV